jgi:hypothetical protein
MGCSARENKSFSFGWTMTFDSVRFICFVLCGCETESFILGQLWYLGVKGQTVMCLFEGDKVTWQWKSTQLGGGDITLN